MNKKVKPARIDFVDVIEAMRSMAFADLVLIEHEARRLVKERAQAGRDLVHGKGKRGKNS